MEPGAKKLRLEKDTLLTSMEEEEINSLLRGGLESTPHAKGISNHMGSRATKDKRLVKALMKQLRRKRLYFLDSMATLYSICNKEAKEEKVRYLKRDIFLDNETDKEYISSQIDKLIGLARVRGSAVGIGHDKKITLEVVKEKAKELKKDGVKFVVASELARR